MKLLSRYLDRDDFRCYTESMETDNRTDRVGASEDGSIQEYLNWKINRQHQVCVKCGRPYFEEHPIQEGCLRCEQK